AAPRRSCRRSHRARAACAARARRNRADGRCRRGDARGRIATPWLLPSEARQQPAGEIADEQRRTDGHERPLARERAQLFVDGLELLAQVFALLALPQRAFALLCRAGAGAEIAGGAGLAEARRARL